MALEQGIRQACADDVTLGGLIGATLGTVRCYDQQAPQGATRPFIVFNRIDTQEMAVHLDGGTGLVKAFFDFDVVAETGASVDSVSDALVAMLRGVTTSLGGVTVQYVQVTGKGDFSDVNDPKRDKIASHDVQIIYYE